MKPLARFLDTWDKHSRVVLGGNDVILFGEAGNRKFGLRRMTLTPADAYIMRLLEPNTDLEYLQRLVEKIETMGVEVECSTVILSIPMVEF